MLQIQKDLRALANPKIAEHSQRFFKTGKGEYGYGDIFLGIRVPNLRKIAKEHQDELKSSQVKKLVRSKYHEERLTGLIVWSNQYIRSKDEKSKEEIYQLYVSHFKYINNWDLVDVTCPHIIGRHLFERDRKIIFQWARSKDLWTKRISIITQLWFIRQNDLDDAFKIAKILLRDSHDLIHKAVGWVLREAGKKDRKRMEAFLTEHYQKMPRTMLRYAIEKLPESRRQKYLKGKV